MAYLDTTRQMCEAIRDLVNQGWTESRTEFRSKPKHSWTGTARSATQEIEAITPCITDVRLVGQWGTVELELLYINGSLGVAPQPDVDLEGTFDSSVREDADRAFSGDLDAALDLEGKWEIEAGVDIARSTGAEDPDRTWVYAGSQAELTAILRNRPWWTLRDLIDCDKHSVFLVDEDSAMICGSQSFSVIGWDCSIESLPRTATVNPPKGFEQLPKLPSVQSLKLTECDHRIHKPLENTLYRAAAAAAWASLATNARIEGDLVELEYFGFQRVSFGMPLSGPEISLGSCRQSTELAEWAQSNEPDKLLAIRQVISLNRSPVIWSLADEIRRAAQPVFVALRSSAISEALKSVREARNSGLAIARQTSEAATALAKGAVERTIATLAAVFGVVVARASQVIPVEIADGLRIIGAAYLVILSTWALFVEGPIVTGGITALKSDVRKYSDFISDDEADVITGLEAVSRARRHAWTVRIAVPTAYIATALAVLTVAR